MVAFAKYQPFIKELFEGTHNLASDTLKLALTNTAPVNTDTVWSTGVYPAPAAANGYTAGGNTATISSSTQTTGTYKQVLADSVFTASGGQMGPFRYVIYYNSSKSNKLIGSYDRGSSVTLEDGDTFTVDFDPTTGAIQGS